AEARRLYAAAREPKRIIVIEGAGHGDAWEGGGEGAALEALAHWTAPKEAASAGSGDPSVLPDGEDRR
ncbi:MAG: hypothetical protein JO008_20245, partial [Alphaproteobacteria bacterium]|nr:hypothetical protein [Alphaproteobacteria bacterium]